MSLNNLIDEHSSALDVVKSRDLSGLVAVVTGANRGVGKNLSLNLQQSNLGD